MKERKRAGCRTSYLVQPHDDGVTAVEALAETLGDSAMRHKKSHLIEAML